MSAQDVDFKVVDLILSSGVLPKDARHQPAFHECIHELSSLPISRLSSEPAYLRECHKRVVEENYKWAYDNYTTFIQTAKCTKQIFEDFEEVQSMNEYMSKRIPDFLSSGQLFVEKCRQSMSLANMNSLTLQKHNQILEILEIPQLLEACIRNNYLDEALELIAHCRKLERRHQNIGIIINVTHEARLAAQKLLEQLFLQLGANLQLPSCLKIVGYLRRMDCLPESLLRLKFLQCRDNYLIGLLRSLASNDPFFHATKYMEVTRVNLFDIATQYRAVFNDEDLYVSSSDQLGQQHNMLFSSWLVMRVDVFIYSLSADINAIVDNSLTSFNNTSASGQNNAIQSVGSKLQSLLGQSMYFGLSLSRIGSDFRGLLLPVFYQAIMKFVDMRLQEISDTFADCIPSYKWTVSLEECADMSLAGGIVRSRERPLGGEDVAAPTSLMNHPLLALLANQLLAVLEDIRLCCPRVLCPRLCRSFSNALTAILHALLRYEEEAAASLTEREREAFSGMVRALLASLLPHIDLCLSLLFSVSPGTCLDLEGLAGLFGDILAASFFVDSVADGEDIDGGDIMVSPDIEGRDNVVSPDIGWRDNVVSPDIEVRDNVVLPDIDGGDIMVSPDIEDRDNVVLPDIEGRDNVVSPDIEGCDNAVLPDIEGCDNAVSPDIEGRDNAVSPDIEGCDNVVSPDIEGCDNAVLPDIEGCDNAVLPDIEGCDNAVSPDIEGFDNAVSPDIDGRDNAVSPDIEGCDNAVSPDIEGCDNAVSPDIEGRDNMLPPDTEGRDIMVSPDIQGDHNMVLTDIEMGDNAVSLDIERGDNMLSTDEERVDNLGSKDIESGDNMLLPGIASCDYVVSPEIEGRDNMVLQDIESRSNLKLSDDDVQ